MSSFCWLLVLKKPAETDLADQPAFSLRIRGSLISCPFRSLVDGHIRFGMGDSIYKLRYRKLTLLINGGMRRIRNGESFQQTSQRSALLWDVCILYRTHGVKRFFYLSSRNNRGITAIGLNLLEEGKTPFRHVIQRSRTHSGEEAGLSIPGMEIAMVLEKCLAFWVFTKILQNAQPFRAGPVEFPIGNPIQQGRELYQPVK